MFYIVVLAFVFFWTPAFGQTDVSAAKEFSFGQYSLPALLTIFTMGLFSFWQVSDRLKPPITLTLGIGLGVLWIFYAGATCTVPTVVDSVFYGAIQGFAAIGIYETQDKARSPTTKERKAEKAAAKRTINEIVDEREDAQQ